VTGPPHSKHESNRLLLALIACAMFSLLPAQAATVDISKSPPAAERNIDFAKDIEPILTDHCYNCHGPKKQEASLRLDQTAAALKGSENGPVILPGKSTDSLLIQAVSWVRDDLKMPKKGERLTAQQVGLLRAWIDQGADWPVNSLAQ